MLLAIETCCDDTCAAVLDGGADPQQRDLLPGGRPRGLRRRRPGGGRPPPPGAGRAGGRGGAGRGGGDAGRDRGGRRDRGSGTDRGAPGRDQRRQGDRRRAPAAADPGRPPAGPRRRQLPRARAAGAALPLPDRQRRPHAAGRRSATTRATSCSARPSTTPPARPSTSRRGCSGSAIPGGPLVQREAEKGDPEAFEMPVAMARDPGLDFSFSGLKTAVLYRCRDLGPEGVAGAPRRRRRLLPGGGGRAAARS